MEANKFETLKTASQYIHKLLVGIYTIVQLIQVGDHEKSLLIFPEIVDGLDWTIKAINLTSDIQKEKIDTTEINDKLKEIIDAFENQDYLFLSDLIEYEIEPIIEEWERILKGSVLN